MVNVLFYYNIDDDAIKKTEFNFYNKMFNFSTGADNTDTVYRFLLSNGSNNKVCLLIFGNANGNSLLSLVVGTTTNGIINLGYYKLTAISYNGNTNIDIKGFSPYGRYMLISPYDIISSVYIV